MNRSSLLLGLGIAAALSANPAIAKVPVLNDTGLIPYVQCPNVTGRARVFYTDSVVFVITGSLLAADANDQAALDGIPHDTELTIKLRAFPSNIGVLKNRVLSFLGAAQDQTNRDNIVVDDVDLTSMVCPVNG